MTRAKLPTTCRLCESGFPIRPDGEHYGTQRLGMIENERCAKLPKKRARKQKLPTTPEAAIQRACMQWLDYRGILWWRTNSGAMKVAAAPGRRGRYVPFNTAKGMADLCAVVRMGCGCGIAAFVEVKSATGRQTDEQKTFQRNVTAAGGLYVLARAPEDIANAISTLENVHRLRHDVRDGEA